MSLDFSVSIDMEETCRGVAEYSRLAEHLGFSHITVVDMPNLCRDVYALMTVATLNTHRIRIGHGVTIPFIRHPSVTANATATDAG